MTGHGLLADTHVLLWYFEGRGKLTDRPVRLLDAALAAGELHGSVASVFEIGGLVRSGRLRRHIDVDAWVRRVAMLGLTLLPLDNEAALDAARLPRDLLPDPIDQLLVATARVNGLTLATRDGAILDYGTQGHVRTLEI